MSRIVLALAGLCLATAPTAWAGEIRRAEKPIPGSYIVVLKDSAAHSAREQALGRPSVSDVVLDVSARYNLATQFVYESALKGFAVRMSAEDAATLAGDPRVAFIEEDGVVTAVATQSPATWGLDRVDQRNLPLNNTYNYNTTASGVHAYIIDTGIRATHNEFAGRMGNGFTAINDGNGTNDCNGHGTHVSGTVGGTTWGVAKGVTLHAVRVLGCTGSGSNAGVVAGVDWVAANHISPAVANMSLGGGASTATDNAVTNAVNAGVALAVAAGNSNANACNSSPSRAAAVLTVGSTTNTDARSSFSNFGTCVDLFAPGSNITSAWSSSDTATNTISGTSMATPHAAGVAALFRAANPGASAAATLQALVNNATTGVVGNPGTGSPNRLLYSIFGGGGGDTTPPTTSITSPANGSTVSGTITISANASDNVGVARVDFFIDGALRGNDASSPYSFSWNTAAEANGGHSLRTEAVDAAGNRGVSGTISVTVNNGGGGGTELITNGGFEGSASPWVLSGTTVRSTGIYPHSGTGYTILGRLDSSTGAEYQTVTIPAGATANLTFWLNVTSSETTTTTQFDRLFVEVRSTSGALLATLGTFSNLNKGTAGVYTQRSFSMAAFRGQTVRVQFRATMDVSLTTSFRVDDVSLR